jgi:PadR family transcriptional regulator, regulatory protein PadR
LAKHGYRLSPGTLYPMLQAMEERGYLISREDSNGRLGRRRKIYAATKEGRRGLEIARRQLRELIGEVRRKDKKSI